MIDNLAILIYNYFKENAISICIISSNHIILSQDYSKIYFLPIQATYTFKHLNRSFGCYEGMESISEYIRYFYTFDNYKEEINKNALLLLKEIDITTSEKIDKLESFIDDLVDKLYYFFDSFNLKLNSVSFKFFKDSNGNFVPMLKLDDNNFYFINLDNNSKCDLLSVAQKICTINN